MSKESISQFKITWLTLTKILIQAFPDDDISLVKIGKGRNLHVSIENSCSDSVEGSLIYDLENQYAYCVTPNWQSLLEEFQTYLEYGLSETDFLPSDSLLGDPEDGVIVKPGHDFIKDR